MQTNTKTSLSFLLLAFSVSAFGQKSQPPADPDRVASIGGQPVLASELDTTLQATLWQLRTQEYELKSRALNALISQKLVEMEAARRGVTAEKLLQDEVDSKIKEPADAEVEAYYLGQKSRLNRPLADVRAALQQALKQAKIDEARQAYTQSLAAKAEITVLLRPPKMEADPRRLRGNPDAPVTIVEFSDFQCPFCKAVQPTLNELLQKYGDRVNLAFRDMPLDQIHPNARKAAEAGRCAAEQGKFWEYQDALFNSGALGDDNLSQQARVLKLDGAAFDSCLASRRYRNQVEADLQMGVKAGVSGTPGFFINGIPLHGSQPLEAFEKVIDAELAAAAAGSRTVASGQGRNLERTAR